MKAKIIKRAELPKQFNELLEMPPQDKGDVIICHSHERNKTILMICCPGCGSSSFTGNHEITINDGFVNAHPSLVFQCCGWHGWLKKGEFTSVDGK